jgi:hypothetical protein
MEWPLALLHIVAAAVAFIFIQRARERAALLAGPAGEREALDALVRARGGVITAPSSLIGRPPLTGASLVLPAGDRRAWADVAGTGPWTVTASVEVDQRLDLEIRRPTILRKRSGSGRMALASEEGTEQPDLRFDVRRARDVRGDVVEDLFIHAGEKLTEPLARILYGLGADEVRATDGRLGATIQVTSLVAERTRELLDSLAKVAEAYARRLAGPALGHMVERYLWLDGGAPRCPYCHVDIAEDAKDLAACARCKTLHHDECFREHGGCTLLGCGETQRAS